MELVDGQEISRKKLTPDVYGGATPPRAAARGYYGLRAKYNRGFNTTQASTPRTNHPPPFTSSVGPVSSTESKPTYLLVSLGCPKNLVDSERMAGLLRLTGYEMVAEQEQADFALVNTCGFIAEARAESYGVIEEMLERKRRGGLRGVIVAGCLAEHQREALLSRYPEIDQVLGVFAREEIAAAASRVLEGRDEHRAVFLPPPSRPLSDGGRLRITSPHVGYLKIAEGCDRRCAFCTIPQIRGRYASKPIEEVAAEARGLADDGVRELVLIAQDTSYYGRDLYGEPRLADLLAELEAIEGLAWIRLMYLYPHDITNGLIERIAGARRVLPYLDLPLQHMSDRVLERMRRGVTRAETERLLTRLRRGIDGLVLRTTLMTGFPGETEAEFEELLDFVERERFERLGVFVYSPEPGTPAAEMGGGVPLDIGRARRDRLMAAQQEIAFAYNRAQVGRRRDVMIDGPVPGQARAYLGRTLADAPEIDAAVYVTGEGLVPGRIVETEIVEWRGYDLIGVACDPADREDGS